MTGQRHAASFLLLVLLALLANASVCVADDWDAVQIRIDPPSPTDKQTFDLSDFRWFPDTGNLRLDQSIAVHGNQIDVRALIQDQHTRPGMYFAQVITYNGASFDNFGPLAAGTYQVNAEIWLTPWPSTSGGNLYGSGSLQFTVSGTGSNQTVDGDYNGDNVVDGADYVAWRQGLGTAYDQRAFNMWRAHFGQTSGSGAASGSSQSAAVPEPCAAILLLGVFSGLSFLRLAKCEPELRSWLATRSH